MIIIGTVLSCEDKVSKVGNPYTQLRIDDGVLTREVRAMHWWRSPSGRVHEGAEGYMLIHPGAHLYIECDESASSGTLFAKEVMEVRRPLVPQQQGFQWWSVRQGKPTEKAYAGG